VKIKLNLVIMTANSLFVGKPLFGTLIALLHNGKPVHLFSFFSFLAAFVFHGISLFPSFFFTTTALHMQIVNALSVSQNIILLYLYNVSLGYTNFTWHFDETFLNH